MSSSPNDPSPRAASGQAVFNDTELAYLATQRLGRLATAQPDGTLQNSPVGFEVNAATGTIDISGFRLASSQKYRNIGDNGRAAFVVDDIASIDRWRCPMPGDSCYRRGSRNRRTPFDQTAPPSPDLLWSRRRPRST